MGMGLLYSLHVPSRIDSTLQKQTGSTAYVQEAACVICVLLHNFEPTSG
jgi:hypothetical protein